MERVDRRVRVWGGNKEKGNGGEDEEWREVQPKGLTEILGSEPEALRILAKVRSVNVKGSRP